MNKKRDKIKDAGYEKHYVYNAHYHLIWCTKYRNQIFTNPDLAQEMRELLKQTAKDNQIKIEKMEVMPEHIHLLISFRPSKSGSSVVKALKGRSGFLFFKNHPEIKQNKMWDGHLWSPSYYFGSVGNMSKEVVEKYINDQIYNAVKDDKPYPSPH
ncbi:IS200/IS605 family transposase [Lactobacillus kefiranofaciens subsp. kefirgranum]|uniref:IS200/IS605 family transposase n=1 Tax=Lactobacillus kefiranofaciens TaxID=267818 RepID=UPI0006F07B85|nr:IS200/IS605 family transposase [Lactobacillus kefiranofaciens]KRL30757.1 transposase [Lactobacillus kefiranofaciens subsp. kefirgranum DSM 10550 = JCM 8572]MCJ2172556.1 IS200/IS605 family transposase [Lactobacillus kefiranofaciens]MCP9331081.1 IS200/IS605 family transposase [Lactobacillus kefiranofaciens]MDF4142970.1 IS200/IS605 family transposase [Lactobacillus kefiranofaciens]PAK98126.1 IS200/IS605 family transposase [Lactobacillus kefiranofaciens]